jgi:acetyltransferase-like isoleucine patch superfamily enzyme
MLMIAGRLFKPFTIYGYFNLPTKSFQKFTRYSSNTVFLNRSNINIDNNCWIGPHCIIDGSGGVKIEKGVQIAGLTAIYTHSSHKAIRLCGESYIHLDPNKRPGYIHKPVIIGQYSFVGVSSVILPGVIIGKGCLIAAGTVLNESIPDFSIVAGNPGKIIGSTIDMDKNYFARADVKTTYFDPEVIAKFEAKV